MNGRFWAGMMVALCVWGAVVPTVARSEEAFSTHPFLKSFYRVEYLNPRISTDSWTFVGMNAAVPPAPPSAMRGRWGVVNIWATWCAPCLYELPKLNTLATALTGSDDPYIWAVSVDREVSRARLGTYITRFGLDRLGAFQDAGGDVRRVLNVDQLPVTFVIGPDGGVRAALYGAAEWDSAAAVDFVRGLDGAKADAAVFSQK